MGWRRMANDFNFLSFQEINSLFNTLHLLFISFFLPFGMESNQSFENFICCKVCTFFFYFKFEGCDMLLDFSVVFFVWIIEAHNRFVDFFFKITEKSFNNSDHLWFSFSNSFLKLLLLLYFYRLMFSYIFNLVVQTLYVFFEKSIKVTNNFMNAKNREILTSKIDRKFAMTYALQCGFLYK